MHRRRGMRGAVEAPGDMYCLISPESQVPRDHPLRSFKKLLGEALAGLSPRLLPSGLLDEDFDPGRNFGASPFGKVVIRTLLALPGASSRLTPRMSRPVSDWRNPRLPAP